MITGKTILDNGTVIVHELLSITPELVKIVRRQRIGAETPEQVILRLIRQSECGHCGKPVYRENQCESCRDYD